MGNTGGYRGKKHLEGSEGEEFNIKKALELATFVEIPISEFWEMTPYELNVAAKSYSKKKEMEVKEKITLAYMTAMWTIQWLGKKHQRPKPLKDILDSIDKTDKEKGKRKVMTDEQMLAQVKVLNAMFGGEVRIIGEK
jgi:hypothetical protein